MLQVATSLRFF